MFTKYYCNGNKCSKKEFEEAKGKYISFPSNVKVEAAGCYKKIYTSSKDSNKYVNIKNYNSYTVDIDSYLDTALTKHVSQYDCYCIATDDKRKTFYLPEINWNRRYYNNYTKKIEIKGNSFGSGSETELKDIPKEYYYYIEDSINFNKYYFIKEEYRDKVIYIHDMIKIFYNAFNHCNDRYNRYITIEKYNEFVEQLKEWREPKYIKNSKEPPYFIINDTVISATVDGIKFDNWYKFITYEVFGTPQVWMFE